MDNIWDGILDVMGIDEATRKEYIAQMSAIPIVGDYLRWSDQKNYMDDYLQNRGLTWEDVKYPALLNAGGNSLYSGVRNSFSFVSKNIHRLYK